ncbi:hypothetical protein [Phaeocystidibacter marisrubri]|uniref:Lipoprotein n=1 Tax=Phaeocystidibacter marisrubri TaxID=1577780 RepID=A0A6L3ZFN1_9FLAO|nr:hypothetical protein [Phaeocystidibacter marisrubri]KAB2816533.1 hypothetical protein F8C82_12695 [Phaeocystidibacter marisrubri]GGH69536.1 hypothetical protein GCM10011318_10650 [Phaeocystidibacter marisrubri]
MKAQLFAIMGMLSLTSCTPKEPETTVLEDGKGVIPTYCTTGDHTVSRDVYEFWLKTFRSFNAEDVDGGPKLDAVIDSLTVTRESLLKLREECEDCPSVRVYFAAEKVGEDQYSQNLLLVNVNDYCNDTAFVDTGILRVTPTEASLISSDEATELYQNWGTYLEAKQDVMPSLFGARAYTFSWSVFDEAFSEENGKMDIHYAMHSLMPADTLDYGYNLLKQGEGDGWMVFNLVVSSNNTYSASSEAMDFAAPCPKYCGKKSFHTPE